MQPTPEFRGEHAAELRAAWLAGVIGAGFEAARRDAGLSVESAADELGMLAADLRAVEAGRELPTLLVLVAAADAFGTSFDALCGRTDDTDPHDAAAALQRLVAAQVRADMQRLVRAVIGVNVEVVRSLAPGTQQGIEMAVAVADAARALGAMRNRCPGFDDLPAGAPLVTAMQRAAAAAAGYRAAVQRAERAAEVRVAPTPLDDALPAAGGPGEGADGGAAPDTSASPTYTLHLAASLSYTT